VQRDQQRDVEGVRGLPTAPPSLMPIRQVHCYNRCAFVPIAAYSFTEDHVRNPNQPSLMPDLVQALSHAERAVVRRLSPVLEAEGCSLARWRVLLLLADGKGHPMSEIAEFALVPAPSLTRLVDRMGTDGLVHRRVDARDRRRTLAHLTPRGRALHRRLDQRVQREQDAVLAEAGPGDAEALLGLLGALAGRAMS
jgi:DNA-binding MarR family transcriptional regulator